MHRGTFVALVCMVLACGGERASTPDASEGTPEAGRDATSTTDAPAEARNDGNSDAGVDGSVCASSARTACMGDSGCYGCPPTWSDALSDRSFCTPSCGYQNEYLWDCGQYEVLARGATDCSRTYYYERSTSALVALFTSCPTSTACAFGPPGFTQPTTCSPSVMAYPCDDGGTE